MKTKTKLSRYAIATLAAWAVCLILLGVGYGLLYTPQKQALAQLQDQCDQSRSELEQAKLASQDETKEKLKLRREANTQIISNFSTEHDAMTELVFQIGQIASELNLAEFSSKHQDQRDHPTIGKSKTLAEAWLEIEFFATFDQFAQFVNRLERNCPVVFVEEVSFRRGSKNGKGHDVSLELSFLTRKEQANKTVAMASD